MLTTWNGRSWRRKARASSPGILHISRALCLNLEDWVTSAWKRGGSFDFESASLIQLDSDLKFTKNFAKSIPLRGAFPVSCAEWFKPRFSAKDPKDSLIFFIFCTGDCMLSVVERMRQCSRHAKVTWAGQGKQFSFLIVLSYTNFMFKLHKYMNFSICIEGKCCTLELLMKIIINPPTPRLCKKYLRLQELPRQTSILLNSVWCFTTTQKWDCLGQC